MVPRKVPRGIQNVYPQLDGHGLHQGYNNPQCPSMPCGVALWYFIPFSEQKDSRFTCRTVKTEQQEYLTNQ